MTANIHREHFHFQAAGHRLRGERLIPANAAAGPVIVFLHEGLGSISQWGAFPAQLCVRTGLPGLVYDRWGHGGSEGLTGPRPGDYLHPEARHHLPEVLTAGGIVEPPILFGHSDGGSIALLFAGFYPDRVRAIITEAAHVLIEDICLEGIRRTGELYEQGDLRAGLRRHHGDHVDLLFRGWHDTWLRADRRDWNMEAELRHVRCPTLVIQGADDEYGTRAQVDAIVAGVSGPAEMRWLADCGHAPHHQARDAVMDAAARFIEGLRC